MEASGSLVSRGMLPHFFILPRSAELFRNPMNPGEWELRWHTLNMKKHVKQCSLDPGLCDLFGFQKAGKLGKGFILIPAGENPLARAWDMSRYVHRLSFCFQEDSNDKGGPDRFFRRKRFPEIASQNSSRNLL